MLVHWAPEAGDPRQYRGTNVGKPSQVWHSRSAAVAFLVSFYFDARPACRRRRRTVYSIHEAAFLCFICFYLIFRETSGPHTNKG